MRKTFALAGSLAAVAVMLQAASGQEGREPVQHDLLAPDCVLCPPSLAQCRKDTAHGDPGICLSHDNHLCVQ